MESNLSNEDRGKVGIYLLVNDDTCETYAGSGILTERFLDHKRNLENGSHVNYKLQRAYSHNNNFRFIGVPVQEEELSLEENRQLALLLEQTIIDEYIDNPLFLNISRDAAAPMSGRKQTPEHIAKRVEKTSGQIRSAEIRSSISNSMTNYWQTISDEKRALHCANLSKAQIRVEEAKNQSEKESRKKRLNDARVKRWEDPVNKKAHSDIMVELFQDQKFRDNHSTKLKESWQDEERRIKASERMKGNQNALGVGVKLKEVGHKPGQACKDAQREAVSRSVMVNGVQYSSMIEASRITGVARTTIYKKCNDGNVNGWCWI